MPRDNKKRGRRADAQKRKLEELGSPQDQDVLEESPYQKKRKTLEQETSTSVPTEFVADAAQEEEPYQDGLGERPFYGLLDEQEQEFFKSADGMLEANQFANSDERTLFLQNIYKESEGKELKLACSQSCSRLLERLILLSTPEQLKSLCAKFNGQFLNLVQHRFASHCCETLFTQSAPVVTRELLEPGLENVDTSPNAEPFASMENLFLHIVNELSGNVGYLITDRFASHALRVLLLVLSGQKLDTVSANSVLKSKKKEKVDVVRKKASEDVVGETRAVPQSFLSALQNLIDQSVEGLDTNSLRTLATHQVANPVLQLLVQLELTCLGKQRAKDSNSIIRTLIPDENIVEGSESFSFINNLMYDPIGSRLLEKIIDHTPGKMFKAIYSGIFKERLGSLARNEIAGYVVSRAMQRLSREDLEAAVDSIVPQISSLIGRGRTAIIRTLIDRCSVRELDPAPIAKALQSGYSDDGGNSISIVKLLDLPRDLLLPEQSTPCDSDTGLGIIPDPSNWMTPGPEKLLLEPNKTHIPVIPASKHASLLTQSMLRTPGPLSQMLFNALSLLPARLCLALALSPVHSPIVQTALTVPHSPLIFRRKLITRFYSHIGALSLDPAGSHAVDAIWHGTQGMAFMRERVAEELAENETPLRESACGRKVWRNWCMDLYRRRRGEWVRMIRESVGNDGFLSFPEDGGGGAPARHTGAGTGVSKREMSLPGSASRARGSVEHDGVNGGAKGGSGSGSGKSKLDLARERHARAQASSSA